VGAVGEGHPLDMVLPHCRTCREAVGGVG
jgi:hypothetical protein